MNVLVKVFLTYAAVSMFSGLMYGFAYAAIVGIGKINLSVFELLWLGPAGIALSIGMPIGLWHLWRTH